MDSQYSIFKTLAYEFRYKLALVQFLEIISTVIQGLDVYIDKQVLGYINGEFDDFNTAMLFLWILVSKELIAKANHIFIIRFRSKYTAQMSASVENLIFSKVFRVSSSTYPNLQKGEFLNYITNDVHKITGMINKIIFLIWLPIKVLMTLYALYELIGIVVIYAFCLIVISFPGVYYLSYFSKAIIKDQRRNSRDKSNLLAEVIDNIKIIKMNSYVKCFTDKLFEIKRNEYINMLKLHTFRLSKSIVDTLSHNWLIFGLYFITTYSTNLVITVTVNMMVLKLLNKLKSSLRTIMNFSESLHEFNLSWERLTSFLSCEEIEYHKIQRVQDDSTTEHSVQINKSNFYWGVDCENDEKSTKLTKKKNNSGNKTIKLEQRVTLKDIDIRIKKGEFWAIIGEVGSGKTSLISTLLGEILTIENETIDRYKDEELDLSKKNISKLKNQIEAIKQSRKHDSDKTGPKIIIDGELSFMEQKPFILNTTIRENILFGEELDESRYNDVIESSQLVRDLEILPGGDLTEIGERGVNLSGGQKARISIARAVYANKEIVLMDDPLSALDAHVKKMVFDNVFWKTLKGKTKILITHAIDFLDKVDKILILQNGRIIEQGSYEELKHKDIFQNIVQHMAKSQNDKENKDSEQTKLEENKTKNKKQNYMSEKTHKLTTNDEDENLEIAWESYMIFFTMFKIAFIFLSINTLVMLANRSIVMYKTYKLTRWIKDFSKTKDPEFSEVFKIIGISFGLTISQFLNGYITIIQKYFVGSRIFKSVIQKLMNASVNLYFDKTTSGKINTRVNNDLQNASNGLPETVKALFHEVFRILMTISMISYYSPLCLLAVPVLFVFIIQVLTRYMALKQQITRLNNAISGPLETHSYESLTGVTTIRAYKRQNMFIDKYWDFIEKQFAFSVLQGLWEDWIQTRLHILKTLFAGFCYAYFIYYREGQDPIMTSILITKLFELQSNVNHLVYKCFDSNKKMIKFQRCLEMLKIPQEDEKHFDLPLDENNQQWMSKGHIKFDNFWARYRPDTEIVLNKINLDIMPGQKIGIVGRTGAGKSTLCLVLCRIIEKIEGSIYIDGVDISNISLSDLRSQITIVPQEPVLFSNTLRFNLDPESKHNDHQLIDIVKRANLGKLLERDGNGLDFEIATKGENLSEGEKAIVCICRAALRSIEPEIHQNQTDVSKTAFKRAKIVLIDEATASIDVNTEQTIQNLMNTEFKDATVLTIAHRLNTVISSDKIMVLSYGKLVEYDDPKVLRNDPDSHFFKLLKQFNQ